MNGSMIRMRRHPASRPAGVGKTHFCQALAGHYGRLIIEMSSLNDGDGLVARRKNDERALDVIAAMRTRLPIIVFIDEIEKGWPNSGAGASSVSMTAGRPTGRTRSSEFMSDARPRGIYFVPPATTSKSSPLLTSGRSGGHGPIFVDLPNKGSKQPSSPLSESVRINAKPKT